MLARTRRIAATAALAAAIPFATTVAATAAAADTAPAATVYVEQVQLDPALTPEYASAPAAEDATTDHVTPNALPLPVIRCLVGIGINMNEIYLIIPYAATGDWASVAELIGTAGVACTRGR